jgi:hypothetical protein
MSECKPYGHNSVLGKQRSANPSAAAQKDWLSKNIGNGVVSETTQGGI